MSESTMELEEIISKQRQYFKNNLTQDIQKRKENLKKIRKLVSTNEQAFADALKMDFGKSYFEVMENEIGLVYSEIRVALKKLNRWSRPQRVKTSLPNLPGKSWIYPVPYGNVLVIAPWNYPIQLALIPVISAIAAGNTVILKPSELTKETSSLLAKLINSEFPPELLYVKEGKVKETQELLKINFDKIFFTGSTQVGRIVMRAAAEHLTPVTLELGGKNPTIILPDCDIKMTAKRIVWGKFHNGGQACVAPDHIYVHESIKDKIIEEVLLNIKKMFGSDASKSEALPRIIDKRHYDRIFKMINADKVIFGGNGDRDSCYIEPTVMHNIDKEDLIMQEEVFGPVMPFLTYSDLNEVMDAVKKQPQPLAFYVFSKDIGLAKKLQKEIRSGGGIINDTVVHFVNNTTPFGGIGESGMGSYHGRYGFACFTHSKTVLSKPLWLELPVKYPPYTKCKLQIIKALLR